MAHDPVQVFEVGPRDGLQNEAAEVSFEDKLFLIRGLVAAGLRDLELGAFVRPDRVPKMADTDRIFAEIASGALDLRGARAWSLVPNRKGLDRAKAAGARRIAVFTAATESFAQRNIGMSIAESLDEFAQVIAVAKAAGIEVRGYVSTAFGCPFEGRVAPAQALEVVGKLMDLGVAQVSIGDTIGVAGPRGVDEVIRPALRRWGAAKVAVHFHDTRGTALANTLRALERGVRVVDSSAGGLGGCPFAPGATGNLATEDLVYLLEDLGAPTGIDLDALARTSLEFARRIRRPLASRYLQACAAKCDA
jgi:hydroxymethylglutaryl-CoA lyase